MKILLTIREINDLGLWETYCKYTGTNVWAMNEGLINNDGEVVLPKELEHYLIKE